jgi:hypothetical protein
MYTNLLLMLATILVVGSGVSLVFFMNSLWDDNKFISYFDSDSDSDVDNSSEDSFSANSPL